MIHNHSHYFVEHSSNSSSFWGAFWGAFLAFAFGLITYWVTKRLERFSRHKNSLVKLDNLINRHLDEIAAAQFQAGDIKNILKEGKLTHYRFSAFNLPDGIELEFGSLDIANLFLGYYSSIVRINSDMRSVNHAFTRFEDVLISGQNLKKENLDFMIDSMEKFEGFFHKLNKRAKETLVIVRLYVKKLREKNVISYGVLNRNWEMSFTKGEIQTEAVRLDNEIEMIRKQSEKEIKDGNN
jgi:hypothetical protein